MISHLAAMRRKQSAYVWHDRKVIAGENLDKTIQSAAKDSDIYVFLVSADFIDSDYCMCKEYVWAEERVKADLAIIIPVIIRECDWDVSDLKTYRALPTDAMPVAQNERKDEKHRRDQRWTDVARGIRDAVQSRIVTATTPEFKAAYNEGLFKAEFIRHSHRQVFDEREILIDPELYSETDKVHISTFSAVVDDFLKSSAVLVTGGERSGKSVLSKVVQRDLLSRGVLSVILDGSGIQSPDVLKVVHKAIDEQFKRPPTPLPSITVIIDNFDECKLPDRIKEQIVRDLAFNTARTIIFAFSSAASILYTAPDMPNLAQYSIEPFTADKIYRLVHAWTKLSVSETNPTFEREFLTRHEKLQMIFDQVGLRQYPYPAVTFLELIETIGSADIAVSSFAACYDTLISQRLLGAGIHHTALDEAKNFLAAVAFAGYVEKNDPFVSHQAFKRVTKEFQDRFFSDPAELRSYCSELFVEAAEGGFYFREDYLWYFLCARHAATDLRTRKPNEFADFVQQAARRIHHKKSANMLIYVAYFTDDEAVLQWLQSALDMIFAKAPTWKLSDSTRSVMLGIAKSDNLTVSSLEQSQAEKNRVALLKESVVNILQNAEQVVARYTVPFISTQIGDETPDDDDLSSLDADDLDVDSYMRNVNALLRIHSVMGHILSTRPGTYNRPVLENTLKAMVRASGRYASLNHSIAALLLYGDEDSIKSINALDEIHGKTFEEKYKKIMSIFGFWSVYLSQVGLARYLSNKHVIRALHSIVVSEERAPIPKGNNEPRPFNYSSVYVVAKLNDEGRLDRKAIEDCIKFYGKDSALFAILRTVVHMYSFYLPMSIEDKQWVAQRLGMSVSGIETQQLLGQSKKGGRR